MGKSTSMRSPNEMVNPAAGVRLETSVKQDKPKAYQSPLWTHLDEIRKWRLGRETWEAIADKLFTKYSLRISLQGVHAFFKRATRRNGRQALGFGSEPSTSIAVQTIVTVAEGPDSIYEEARKAIRDEQQSKPKIIRPDRPL